MSSLRSDLTYAIRGFRSARAGLLISIAVVALAIGAGTATYSVVSAVVLRSLPFDEPEQLVSARVAPVEARPLGATVGATMSRQVVELLVSSPQVLDAAPFAGGDQPVLTGIGEPERLDAWRVPAHFFSVLGSRPALGRVLTPADSEGGGAPVVVISHRFWTTRLLGAPDVIGRKITLNGQQHEIVGVMPRAFDFPTGAQLWQPAPPLEPALNAASLQGRYWLVGRLAPGITIEQALSYFDARFAAYALEQPDFAEWRANLAPVEELLIGPVRRPLLLLLAAVAFVILIACANMASVLLARGIARRRELAIRLSLGASRRRVARQLMLEAVVLALISGLGGIVVAFGILPPLLAVIGEQLPRATEIRIDWRVLGAALATSATAGLIAGTLPALVALRTDYAEMLKGSDTARRTSFLRARAGEALVIFQVGLGSLLLAGSALLGFSFLNMLRVELGFDTSRVVVAQFRLPVQRYGTDDSRQAFLDHVLQRAAAIPGVREVAASDAVPFRGPAIGTVELPGEDVPPGAPASWITHATPTYFAALGVPLLRGKGFTEGTASEGDGVIVNESFVRSYFPGRDPLGRTITFYGATQEEIVGVVADTHQASLVEAEPQIYVPWGLGTRLKIIVRTSGDVGLTEAALREAIRSIDPLLPIEELGPLEEVVGGVVAPQRLYASVLGAFALIALLTTTLGMYGLAAYSLSRRTRELGIRMAVGATRGHIRSIVLGRVLLLAGVGLVLGLVAAAAGGRVVEGYVFGIEPNDPVVSVFVCVTVVCAAVAAAYQPARRAGLINPAHLLRAE